MFSRRKSVATVEDLEISREQTKTTVQRERAFSKLGRDNRAAELEARRAEELAATEHRARLEEIRAEAEEARRVRQAQAWTRRRRKALTLTPLLAVNAAAVYGQISYFFAEVSPAAWLLPARLVLAVMLAFAVESIALFVGWHAHDALLLKHYATASRLRRASYGIAVAVGWINYSHFVGDIAQPTAAGLVFGGLSLLSPWLWGLHTRREQHKQLAKEGLADVQGAQFSPARWRNFPWRTWQARRYSIDHGVTEPRQAWAAYKAARASKTPAVAQVPAQRQEEPTGDLDGVEPTSGQPLDFTSLAGMSAVYVAHAALGKVSAREIIRWLEARDVKVSESLVYKARKKAGASNWDTGEFPLVEPVLNGQAH